MNDSQKISPWKTTCIAAMTSYIDAGSIVAGAAGLALWQNYLGLTAFLVGLLTAFSSNAFGAAIGAIIGGPLCDRYGRKFVYTYDLLVYIAGMFLIVFAFSHPVACNPFTLNLFGNEIPVLGETFDLGYLMLFFGYFIVGTAVGADVVASWTLIAEQAPAENRARHCGAAQFAWAIGPAVVLLMNAALGAWLGSENALLGNRIVFGHLIVVAFITWLLRLGMPESENWKVAKEKERELIASGEIKEYGMRALFKWVNLKTVLFLSGVYVVWNWAAGTMGFLLPYIYESVGGVSNSMACALTVILFLASALSTIFIFMMWGDRISRRAIYCVIASLFVVGWGLFLLPVESALVQLRWTVGSVTIPVLLVLISVLMGINNGSGQQAFYQLWCSELFPARYRASAQGFTFFAARITVGVWTFCVPIIMENIGFALAAKIMVGFALFSLFVGTIFAPNTSGKTLEQIEEERYGKF